MWPERPTVVGPCSPYAPVLESVYRSIARILPSFIAPRRIVTSISWRGVDAVWDSSLVKIIFDGFPVFQVTNAGKISATTVCFAPNPPPILGLETRIFDFGMHNALDKILRTWNTICVELTTFNLPYSSIKQYVLKVSIIACWAART